MEHLRTKLILCCALALTFSISAWAATLHEQMNATITVDTTSDVISNDGLCSLREAIVAANTDSPYQGCPGGSGADTVVFSPDLPQPATITLAIGGTGEDGALAGDLDIIGNLTISATTAIVDGNGLDRVFEILPGARVTISGVTLRNGDPGAGVDGGGVAIDLTAVLTLTHSSVISNTARRGGGIQVLGRLNLSDAEIDANQGGGINNDGGLSTLENVQVRRNGGLGIRNDNIATLAFSGGTVSHNQGGVHNNSSSATLSNVVVISNTGSSGVFSTGSATRPAWLTVSACTILSNTATNGGGILSQGLGARASVIDTDISGNVATSAGGGLFSNGFSMTVSASTIRGNQARSGGGIDHYGGSLALTNNTISGNSAGDNGGGLYNRSTSLLTNVTFSGNTAGGLETGGNIFNDTAQVSIVNSIVAYSEADGNCFNSEGSINSLGHNLETGDTCGFAATGDITDTNPLLGALQDNGGPTLTHALNPGSPALDTGDDTECPASDQRGVSRPQGVACDIGAYEYAGTADVSISKVRQGTGNIASGERITYTITISNAGPTAPLTATVVDTWTPVGAVVGVYAPGCAVDSEGGAITCSYTNLGEGSAMVPGPQIIFTTSAAFSGTLANSASVNAADGISDPDPGNNVSGPVIVTVLGPIDGERWYLYLPVVITGL